MKYKDFKLFAKLRLSYSVVFSSVIGYLLGVVVFSWEKLIGVVIGGLAMVIASNMFNQVIEKDLDALMRRTENRPLPQGRVGKTKALFFAVIFAVLGIIVLCYVNYKTASFGALSLFLYVAVYTPLKTRTPFSVFVGAIPGAIPFMLGWVAATNSFGIEPGVLFMIQFFWQFPHFWAIAWLLDEDYKKAGFKMLPTLKKDKKTAFQIVFYVFWTLSISLVPTLGITGRLHLSIFGGILVGSLGIALFLLALKLYRKQSDRVAKNMVFATILYITLLQIIYVLDKYIG